jgi:hypothetical protein
MLDPKDFIEVMNSVSRLGTKGGYDWDPENFTKGIIYPMRFMQGDRSIVKWKFDAKEYPKPEGDGIPIAKFVAEYSYGTSATAVAKFPMLADAVRQGLGGYGIRAI